MHTSSTPSIDDGKTTTTIESGPTCGRRFKPVVLVVDMGIVVVRIGQIPGRNVHRELAISSPPINPGPIRSERHNRCFIKYNVVRAMYQVGGSLYTPCDLLLWLFLGEDDANGFGEATTSKLQ